MDKIELEAIDERLADPTTSAPVFDELMRRRRMILWTQVAEDQ